MCPDLSVPNTNLSSVRLTCHHEKRRRSKRRHRRASDQSKASQCLARQQRQIVKIRRTCHIPHKPLHSREHITARICGLRISSLRIATDIIRPKYHVPNSPTLGAQQGVSHPCNGLPLRRHNYSHLALVRDKTRRMSAPNVTQTAEAPSSLESPELTGA